MTYTRKPGIRKCVVICGICFLIVFQLPLKAGKGNVVNSLHNLSVSGPGGVTSSETQVCIFCHTPHSSLVNEKPLWNHQLSIQSYTTYISSTMASGTPPPGQLSKQCLSCHDGTVALGQTVANGLIPVAGTMGATKNLGTDLRNDHPISFPLADDGQLTTTLFQNPPATGDPAIKLFDGQIECNSCHSPHDSALDPIVRKFLVRSNQNSAMCLVCHDPSRPQPNALNGWNTGAHKISANATPSTSEFGGYGTVAANGCVNCHLPHGAPLASSARLLRNPEEADCSPCHSGTNLAPALLNVMTEFNKIYSHPATTVSGAHDPAENAFPLSTTRHAECADCHNPHATGITGGSALPPLLQAPLLGASGVDGATGVAPLRPASNQYEICFKCHANSPNKPQTAANYATFGRTPNRVTDQTAADPFNARLEFNSSISRHPVTQPRVRTSADVPSLRATMLNLDNSAGRSMAAGTYIYCTDCHTNNAARSSRGAGPNGPHGSTWTHLLERRYEAEIPPATPGGSAPGITYTPGLNGTFALCDKCHDIDNSVRQDRSFKKHNRHIDGVGASCSTCHDSHGIQGGNATNNINSVNFDLTIVGPTSAGALRFERTGTFSGRCFLKCHNIVHNPKSY